MFLFGIKFCASYFAYNYVRYLLFFELVFNAIELNRVRHDRQRCTPVELLEIAHVIANDPKANGAHAITLNGLLITFAIERTTDN